MIKIVFISLALSVLYLITILFFMLCVIALLNGIKNILKWLCVSISNEMYKFISGDQDE